MLLSVQVRVRKVFAWHTNDGIGSTSYEMPRIIHEENPCNDTFPLVFLKRNMYSIWTSHIVEESIFKGTMGLEVKNYERKSIEKCIRFSIMLDKSEYQQHHKGHEARSG